SAGQQARVENVSARGQRRIQPGGMRQYTEQASRPQRFRGDVYIAHARDAYGRHQHRGKDAQAGGLARAVRTEQARDAAVARRKADAVERDDFAESLAESVDFDHAASIIRLRARGRAWTGRTASAAPPPGSWRERPRSR